MIITLFSIIIVCGPCHSSLYFIKKAAHIPQVSYSDSIQSDIYETIVKQGPKPGVGVWLFTLNPMATGTTVSVQVEGENGVLTLSDVIFGDVWVCSGQSNMEFTVNMVSFV